MSYSNFKAAFFQNQLKDIRNERPSVTPIHVQLIISDFCNQSCSFCAYRNEDYTSNQLFGVESADGRNNNPMRMISKVKCFEIINDCKSMGVNAIQFTGGGEPTAHPNFDEILRLAQALDIDTALVSNGVAWKDRYIDDIAHCKWARVSIDAGDAETYSAIRRVPASQFHSAIENVKKLVDAKRRLQTDIVIGVGFVVTRENFNEVDRLATIASDIGVDNMRISAVFQSDNALYFKGFEDQARESIASAKSIFPRTIDLFSDRLNDLQQGRPDYDRCAYQYFTTYIGGDLNVYRCCVTSYNERGLLASIKDKSFAKVWHDEIVHKLGSFNPKFCERCQFNDKNRVMNYLINKDDEHANFV